MIFLLSFGFFLLVTNYTKLGGPSFETASANELKADLQALGPFKLNTTGKDATEVLSREKALIFAKVLLRHDVKLRDQLRVDILKERRNLYQSESWPYYE